MRPFNRLASADSLSRMPSDQVEAVRIFVAKHSNAALSELPVALRLGNKQNDLAALLACWQVGLVPLILPAEATDDTVREAMADAGCGLEVVPGAFLTLNGKAGERRFPGIGALLTTSGSTGRSRIVPRKIDSLEQEGQRYIDLLNLNRTSPIHIISPCAHAYAFGWLCAALLSNSPLNLIRPTQLGAAVKAFETGGWCVLTPTLARLLVARGVPKHYHPGPKLGVMAGAGAVDAVLRTSFFRCFGVPLSRNYGSTETGALFAATGDVEADAIGWPMPDIIWRLHNTTEATANTKCGELEVFNGKHWHRMGDILQTSPGQPARLVARSGAALRRGDRFVATHRAVTCAEAAPGVRSARARVLDRDGRYRFALDIWPCDPGTYNVSALNETLAATLGPDSPDFIRTRILLERSEAGKIQAPRAYRVAVEGLDDIARAYKKSHLAMVLFELGVLDLLQDADVEEIADALALDTGALEYSLVLAEAWGIVEPRDKAKCEATNLAVLSHETVIAQRFNSVSNLKDVLRTGPGPRDLLPTKEAARYAELHQTRAARLARQMVYRKISSGKHDNCLFVGSGAVAYPAELAEAGIEMKVAKFWPVGSLTDVPDGVIVGPSKPEERFDLCVLSNAVHWPPLGSCLRQIWEAVLPSGLLVVEDFFLTNCPAGADIALDWLTHGGLSNIVLDDVLAELEYAGASVEVLHCPTWMGDKDNGWRAVIARKGMK